MAASFIWAVPRLFSLACFLFRINFILGCLIKSAVPAYYAFSSEIVNCLAIIRAAFWADFAFHKIKYWLYFIKFMIKNAYWISEGHNHSKNRNLYINTSIQARY